MSDDAALPRETGAEKAPTTCSNCGAEVPAVESPYGGISGAACPKCYPAAPREQASTSNVPPPLPRETGTAPTPPEEN